MLFLFGVVSSSISGPVATTPTDSQPWPSPKATKQTWPTNAPAWPPTRSPWPTRKTRFVPTTGLSKGAIIGITVAAIVVVVAIALVITFATKRKNRKNKELAIRSIVSESPLIENRKTI